MYSTINAMIEVGSSEFISLPISIVSGQALGSYSFPISEVVISSENNKNISSIALGSGVVTVEKSLSEVNTIVVFNVFPNPVTKGFFTIDGLSNIKRSNISIFDSTGKETNSFRLNGSRVDVSALSKGVYTVRIVSDKNTVVKKLIIK